MLLLALILTGWLAVLALGVVLCRAAAGADDALQRDASQGHGRPTGIGLWPDPPDAVALDLRPVDLAAQPVVRERLGAHA
jgi:hypothetical protein